MPKLDLTQTRQMKTAAGRVKAVKGDGFVWPVLKPANDDLSSITAYHGDGSYALDFEGLKYKVPGPHIDYSRVTEMVNFLKESDFNQPVQDWVLPNSVINMYSFLSNTPFNQPIQNWVLPDSVENMSHFLSGSAFNQPVQDWVLPNSVINMSLFLSGTPFNQPVQGWVLPDSVEDMHWFLIDTPFKKYDVHVLPQSQLICIGDQIVPKFVGRVEQIDEHWAELRDILARKGITVMESLPQKNVRRSDGGSLKSYFNSDALIEKTMRIYGDDVRLFYNDVSVDHLIQKAPLPAFNTLHSKGLKLSNWLHSLGFHH